MTAHARYSAFFPDTLEPTWLERTLVRDNALLTHLTTSLTKTLEGGGARFDLVVGSRGQGKSHFICTLTRRIANSLNEGVVVHVRPTTPITSMVTFLAAVLGAMPVQANAVSPERQLANLHDLSPELYEERALAMIKHNLQKQALLIVLDDLDHVFESMGAKGQQRLRALLQQEGDWSLLGSATTKAPHFTQATVPFFRAFSFHTLDPLSVEQFAALLTRLADVQGTRSHVELNTIAKIAGQILGLTPRAAVALHPHLSEGELREVLIASLTRVALELAPVYCATTMSYSPTQRAIIDTLAQSTQPLMVNQLAARLFTTHQTVSGLLARLRAAGVVQSERSGRASYYSLLDPLHRFSRLIRHRPDTVAGVVDQCLASDDAMASNNIKDSSGST